ncbi:hypothetical protein GGX14DRAFT_392788 [Mycena pura]|uniref:Uncharacterized protein n=1 Tax=Mycena pura TaxID=153505 RepID=A0AAD6VIR8_9AGAR|nr:hypothetical protein GGX14DRAFT_392788 [Mycena pura]
MNLEQLGTGAAAKAGKNWVSTSKGMHHWSWTVWDRTEQAGCGDNDDSDPSKWDWVDVEQEQGNQHRQDKRVTTKADRTSSSRCQKKSERLSFSRQTLTGEPSGDTHVDRTTVYSKRRDSWATSNERNTVKAIDNEPRTARDRGCSKSWEELGLHIQGNAPLVVDCLGQNVYPTMNALQSGIGTGCDRCREQAGCGDNDDSDPSKWDWVDVEQE